MKRLCSLSGVRKKEIRLQKFIAPSKDSFFVISIAESPPTIQPTNKALLDLYQIILLNYLIFVVVSLLDIQI